MNEIQLTSNNCGQLMIGSGKQWRNTTANIPTTMKACMHECSHVHTCYICACMHACVHACVCVYAYIYIYTYTYMHARLCVWAWNPSHGCRPCIGILTLSSSAFFPLAALLTTGGRWESLHLHVWTLLHVRSRSSPPWYHHQQRHCTSPQKRRQSIFWGTAPLCHKSCRGL